MSNAFPIYTPDMPIEGGPGLTKRELFAAMALQGWLAGCGNSYGEFTSAPKAAPLVAMRCVGFADALLAELQPGRPPQRPRRRASRRR